jgi:HEAT repeat protein
LDLLPQLGGALDDDNEDVRHQAAWTLSYMNHPGTLPLLLQSLTHPDARVQAIACTGLGWLGRTIPLRGQIVPTLVQVYEAAAERTFEVRLEAASVLLEWGEIREPSVFLEAIKRGHATRPAVRKAIVRFERKDAILLLIKHLATYAAKTDTSNECALALEHLTGEHLGTDAVAWYRWFEKNRASLPDQLE